jgi:hypothetical protein
MSGWLGIRIMCLSELAVVYRDRIDLLPSMLNHFPSSIVQSAVTNYALTPFHRVSPFNHVFTL